VFETRHTLLLVKANHSHLPKAGSTISPVPTTQQCTHIDTSQILTFSLINGVFFPCSLALWVMSLSAIPWLHSSNSNNSSNSRQRLRCNGTPIPHPAQAPMVRANEASQHLPLLLLLLVVVVVAVIMVGATM
jgi:hypothetical protein